MSVTKAVIPAAGLRHADAAGGQGGAEGAAAGAGPADDSVRRRGSGGRRDHDVLLITSPAKRAVEQHFSPIPSWSSASKRAGKAALLASIRAADGEGEDPRRRPAAAARPGRRGPARARLRRRRSRSSACSATRSSAATPTPSRKQLIDAHREFGTSVIGLEEVPPEKVERYGIVGGTEIAPGVLQARHARREAVGRDRAQPAGDRRAVRAHAGDLRLPRRDAARQGRRDSAHRRDPAAAVARRSRCTASCCERKRHDIGNPLDWLKTNLVFAARDAKLWEQIAPLARVARAHARRSGNAPRHAHAAARDFVHVTR